MRAKSIKGSSLAEIQNALESCMDDGFRPTLAVMFVSKVQNRDEICSLLDEQNISIFGAMAGDDMAMTEQFVFTNGRSSNRAIVTLVIDTDKVSVKGRAMSAWKAMGTEKLVTKSEGNRVFTIDEMPAVDITAKYAGVTDISPNSQDLIMALGVNCTLQLLRDSGQMVMRPGLVVDWDDHSMYCSGSVPQGAKVRFSTPPDFDVIEKVIEGCKELKETEMQDPDALIMFSCTGRFLAFGPLMREEIKAIREIWNVPMVGFFSNAELGRDAGGNLEMHNLTSCNVVLKEK
jgi:hypothetical protein